MAFIWGCLTGVVLTLVALIAGLAWLLGDRPQEIIWHPMRTKRMKP